MRHYWLRGFLSDIESVRKQGDAVFVITHKPVNFHFHFSRDVVGYGNSEITTSGRENELTVTFADPEHLSDRNRAILEELDSLVRPRRGPRVG